MSRKFDNGEIRIKPAREAEIVGLDIEKDVVECIQCNPHKPETVVGIDPTMRPGTMFASQVLDDFFGPGTHKGLTGKILGIHDHNRNAVRVRWNNGAIDTMNIAKIRVAEKPKLKVGDMITSPEQMDDVPLNTLLFYAAPHPGRPPYDFAIIRTGIDGWQKTDATNLYMSHKDARRLANGRELKVMHIREK